MNQIDFIKTRQNILTSDFFYHRYFDAYVLGEAGSDGKIPPTWLTYFIDRYYAENPGADIGPNNIYRDNFLTKCFRRFKDDCDIDNNKFSIKTGSDLLNYQKYIFNAANRVNCLEGLRDRASGIQNGLLNLNNNTREYYILSGWNSNATPGHAINILIVENMTSPLGQRRFTVNIINSGDGIQYHTNGAPDYNTKNIIMIYNNVEESQINDIVRLVFLAKNANIAQELHYFKSHNNKFKLDSVVRENIGYGLNIDPIIFLPYINHPLLIELQTNEMDGDVYYCYLKEDIFRKRTNSLFIQDTPQLSGSCSYFAPYFTIKHLIYKDPGGKAALMAIDNFIDGIVLKYYINRFNDIDMKTYYAYGPKTNRLNFNNTDTNNKKHNLEILNIAQILYKDYHSKLEESDLKLLRDKITCEYFEVDNISNFYNFTFAPEDAQYFSTAITSYNELKRHCNMSPHNDTPIIFQDLINLLDHFRNFSNIINPYSKSIGKLFILYTLIRSIRLFKIYFTNNTMVIRDYITNRQRLNNIFQKIEEIDKDHIQDKDLSISHSSMINIRLLDIILPRLPHLALGINNNNLTVANYEHIFRENYIFRPYYNINFNIDSFFVNLRPRVGWILNNSYIDLKRFIKPSYGNSNHGLEDNHYGENVGFDPTSLTSSKYYNHNILLYNINQINNNNYNELKIPLPITGSEFFSSYNFSKYSGVLDVFDNDISYDDNKFNDNDLYSIAGKYNTTNTMLNSQNSTHVNSKFYLFNKRNMQNENFHIEYSIIKTLNIQNLFKNLKLIKNKILIDQLFFLIMIHRRDEVDPKLMDELKNKYPNNITSRIFNCDYNEIDLINPFSLYYVLNNKEILSTDPSIRSIYDNYEIENNKKLFEGIDNNELNNKIRNDSISMIIASIFIINDTDALEYDNKFFQLFNAKLQYKQNKNIPSYTMYDLNDVLANDVLANNVYFLDFPLYLDNRNNTKYYYNNEFNYLTRFNIVLGLNNSITKSINNVLCTLVSDRHLFTEFPDLQEKIIIHFCQRIQNFSKIYIWINADRSQIYVELLGFDKVHFKFERQLNNKYLIKYINNHEEQLEYDEITNSYIHLSPYEEFNVEEKYEMEGDNISVNNTNNLFGIWTKGAVNHFIISKDNEYYMIIFSSNKYFNNFILKNPNEEIFGKGGGFQGGSEKSNIQLIWNHKLRPEEGVVKFNKDINKFYKMKLHHTFTNFDIEPSDYIAILNSLILSKNNLAIFLICKTLSNIINRFDVKEISSPEISEFRAISKYLDVPLVCLFNFLFFNYNTDKKEYERREDFYCYSPPDLINNLNININDVNIQRLTEICRLSDNLSSTRRDFTPLKNSIINAAENELLQNFIRKFRGNCDVNRLCLDRNKEISRINDSDDINIFDSLLKKNTLALLSNIYIKYRDYYYNSLIRSKFLLIYKEVIGLVDLNCDCNTFAKSIEPLDYQIIYNLDKPRKIEDIIFEIQYSNFIRAEQKDMLYRNITSELNVLDKNDCKIIDDLNQGINNKIYEILMGRGKTAVITPLILLNQSFNSSTSEITSYYVVLPKHLVQTSFDILFRLSDLLTNISISTYEKNGNNIRNIELLKKNNVLSIISDELIKEYILRAIIDSPTIPTDIFTNKNLFIFDEIDSLIDPFKSDLNIPNNPIKHKNHDNLVEYIYNFMLQYYNDQAATFDDIYSRSCASLDATTSFAIAFKSKMQKTFKIVKGMHYNQSYGFGNVSYKKWSELLDDDPDAPNHKNFKPLFAAIPYSANNSPVNGSEFSDFELSIALTSYTYIINKIRPVDLYIYLNEVMKKYKFNKELCAKLFPEIINPDIIPLSFLDAYYNSNEEAKVNYCKKYVNWYKIRTSNTIRKSYLKIIFNKYFKISICQSNISMIDVFSHYFCNKKVAFSGSVNINLPRNIIKDILDPSNNNAEDIKFINNYEKIEKNIFSEIIADKIVKGSIISSLYGITRVGNILNDIVPYDKQNSKLWDEVKFLNFLKLPETLVKYSAIIDSAGLIISKPAEMVIDEIYRAIEAYNRNPPPLGAAIPIRKTLLYVQSDGTRMIYNNGSKIIKKKYNNEKFNDALIFYDHKHTVGIDFKQPTKMIGLISVSRNNNLTEISQGIYRLRSINLGHNVDYYLDSKITKKENDSNQDAKIKLRCLVELLQNNDQKFIITSDYNMKKQCLKFLNRNIYNTKNTYEEDVFYDLIDVNGTYNNEEQFNIKLVKDLCSSLSGKLQFREIQYKEKVVQNKNLSVQLNIAKEIAQELEKEVSLFDKTPNISYGINPVSDNYGFGITNINNITDSIHGILDFGRKSIPNLSISDINFNVIFDNYRKNIKVGDSFIGFTPVYLKLINIIYNGTNYINDDFIMEFRRMNSFLYPLIKDLFNKDSRQKLISRIQELVLELYFIYSPKNPKKITIMTSFDLIAILTDYEKVLYDTLHPTGTQDEIRIRMEHLDCYKEIVIYDKYNNIIFNVGDNDPKISNVLRLLLMKDNFSIIDKYKAIQEFIKVRNQKEIFIFMQYILDYKLDFSIFSGREYNAIQLYNLIEHDKYENWQKTRILPTADTTSTREIDEIIDYVCKEWDCPQNIIVDWEKIIKAIEDEELVVLANDPNNSESLIEQRINERAEKEIEFYDCQRHFNEIFDNRNNVFNSPLNPVLPVDLEASRNRMILIKDNIYEWDTLQDGSSLIGQYKKYSDEFIHRSTIFNELNKKYNDIIDNFNNEHFDEVNKLYSDLNKLQNLVEWNNEINKFIEQDNASILINPNKYTKMKESLLAKCENIINHYNPLIDEANTIIRNTDTNIYIQLINAKILLMAQKRKELELVNNSMLKFHTDYHTGVNLDEDGDEDPFYLSKQETDRKWSEYNIEYNGFIFNLNSNKTFLEEINSNYILIKNKFTEIKDYMSEKYEIIENNKITDINNINIIDDLNNKTSNRIIKVTRYINRIIEFRTYLNKFDLKILGHLEFLRDHKINEIIKMIRKFSTDSKILGDLTINEKKIKDSLEKITMIFDSFDGISIIKINTLVLSIITLYKNIQNDTEADFIQKKNQYTEILESSKLLLKERFDCNKELDIMNQIAKKGIDKIELISEKIIQIQIYKLSIISNNIKSYDKNIYKDHSRKCKEIKDKILK
jgi:hypothetical protein